ncbi:MAG: type III-B CRISPR module-associated protein Cmr5, partial [Gammaproteobacteria bacterium]|nr:type III-B CRISPR module-associated protein Cmr5 [Gammaproteobacteria bacterium]
MKTRAQTDSKLAYDQISKMLEEEQEKEQKAYGGLCHHFPMLMLRSGLCQAVAFYVVKAKGKTNQKAYQHFLEHMATAAGNNGMNHEQFQQSILTMEPPEYQRITRRILAAAIWYKRFAVSLLDVDQAGEVK